MLEAFFFILSTINKYDDTFIMTLFSQGIYVRLEGISNTYSAPIQSEQIFRFSAIRLSRFQLLRSKIQSVSFKNFFLSITLLEYKKNELSTYQIFKIIAECSVRNNQDNPFFFLSNLPIYYIQ